MRYLWLALFALLILALAFGPQLVANRPKTDETLNIISPHWDGIRNEFGRAFEQKYFEQSGKHIHVVWLDIGGTGEIRKWLDQRMAQVKGTGKSVGADILFGGGMDMLPGMAAKDYFQPYTPAKEILDAIPESVNGQELRDKQNRYHAACLGMFGFVYNKQVIVEANLPKPQTWDDMGQSALQGWITCGDPGQSGSLHQAFEIVLQAEGWEKGYAALTRLASNARAFNEGGASIPRDVSLGQAAAGPCIDFYASAPVRRQGATHLQLVIPAGATIATPDCIAILKSPANAPAAEAFMKFVLSEDGQRLWYQPRATEGGPQEYDLERLPVMPSTYEKGYPTNTVSNPFKDKASFKYDGKKAGARWNFLNDLWKSLWMDTHEELWSARKAVVAAGRDADLGMALAQPPFSEDASFKLAAKTKSMTPDERNALKNKWVAWGRNWYAQIEHAAETNGPVPVITVAPSE